LLVGLWQRLQKLDQISLLGAGQTKVEATVVVIDDGLKRRETTVVEKAAFLVRPQSFQRRCPIPFVGGSVRLEVVDANLLASIHVPAWLRIESLLVQ